MVNLNNQLFIYIQNRYTAAMTLQRKIALVLFLFGLLGLVDSFYLVTEYFAALASNGAPTPCSPSSLVNCTKTVQGSWAHLLGTSNPLFGMLWYGMFTMYGFLRLQGSTITRNARMGIGILTALGIVFSYTLYLGSVLVLRGVCPFCLTSTLTSTILLFAFILDDRLYTDALITNTYLPVVHVLQGIALLTYGVGLPLFLSINIPLLVQPLQAITHWSFPVMVVLIIGMWAANWLTWNTLHMPVPSQPKKTWLQKMLGR